MSIVYMITHIEYISLKIIFEFNILHKKHAANKANVETFEPKRCSIDNILNEINNSIIFYYVILLFIYSKRKRLKPYNNGDWGLGIGDWGLGIGDWGLGIGPNPQSPIPNPHVLI